MVSTRNKRIPSYHAPERNDCSESAGGSMVHSIRHKRRLANSSATTQTNEGSGTAGDASPQVVEAPPTVPTKKRGRKAGSQTKLKLPPRGVKVAFKPSGDMQFSYIHYPPIYKYTTQLGVILRREYPGVIVEVDENGDEFKRPALDWADYFHKNPGAKGMTRGENVVSEFCRLFQVAVGDQQEANCVLEGLLKKRVKDMMYQVRVNAVKQYYREIKHIEIKDAVACHIDLEYEQYEQGKLEWLDDEAWLLLCAYWCSDDYKVKRKGGRHLAQVMKILLKTEEDLDHSQRHNNYWKLNLDQRKQPLLILLVR